MSNATKINLETFAQGAMAEKLNIELQKVMENIHDPNTDPTMVNEAVENENKTLPIGCYSLATDSAKNLLCLLVRLEAIKDLETNGLVNVEKMPSDFELSGRRLVKILLLAIWGHLFLNNVQTEYDYIKGT